MGFKKLTLSKVDIYKQLLKSYIDFSIWMTELLQFGLNHTLAIRFYQSFRINCLITSNNIDNLCIMVPPMKLILWSTLKFCDFGDFRKNCWIDSQLFQYLQIFTFFWGLEHTVKSMLAIKDMSSPKLLLHNSRIFVLSNSHVN